MGYRVKSSEEKNDSLPSKDLGVPFYRRVDTEEAKNIFWKAWRFLQNPCGIACHDWVTTK
jgi:hypothetical protein